MDKIAIKPEEASQLTGIGRDEIYRLCYTPGFPAFRVGRKILIDVEGLRKWMGRQAEIRAGFSRRRN